MTTLLAMSLVLMSIAPVAIMFRDHHRGDCELRQHGAGRPDPVPAQQLRVLVVHRRPQQLPHLQPRLDGIPVRRDGRDLHRTAGAGW